MIAAGAMVVLIAIGAIVLDLGMSWMLHRQEQNAADPGALAAAKWVPANDMGMMEAEACFYAQQNGFFLGDSGCTAALSSGDLEVNSPPSSTMSGNFRGRPGYVEVIIADTHPSFFGQFFGRPTAEVTTAAVAALTNGNANASSLVALQDVCQGGSAGSVNGGGTLWIHPATGVPANSGGYINVNSPCGGSTDDQCTNGVGQSAFSISGEVIAPFAFVNGTCTIQGNSGPGLTCEDPATDPCLDEGAIPLGDPLADLPEPNIADFPAPACPNGQPQNPNGGSGCAIGGSQSTGGSDVNQRCTVASGDYTCTLSPGVYYGGWTVATRTVVNLRPGMYILAGGGIRLSGGSDINAVAGAGGIEPRITIFSTDGPRCPSVAGQCQGNITFTASQGFVAKATNTASCQALIAQGWGNTCPWRGILLWQDGTVNNTGISRISLGGQASTTLAGTIYAPRGDVQIDGGTNTTGCDGSSTQSCLAIQIISWTWTITGNSMVEMPYDPSELYQLEQQGLVH